MIQKIWIVSALILGVMLAVPVQAAHRILYVDSYHEGYEWSDGITNGIKKELNGKDVVLKIHRMDTKRNGSEQFKQRAGQEAKEAIENFRPNIVIASDDNAAKYLISQYYKNDKLPFVFCGVNYTAEAYGFPCSNVTGMLEVPPAAKLIYSMKHFTRITKVGYLASDTETERKDGEFTKRDVREEYVERYAKTFDEWKKLFVSMQDEVDMLIVGNNAGINDWDDAEAERFAMVNTRKVTGCLLDWMTNKAFLGCTRIAEEQGEYAAKTALKILGGTQAKEIPLTRNTQANIIINKKIAGKLGIKVPESFMKIASKVIE
jgi:ABC-type uncharacterized transport system substrate-binding protein